MFPYGNFGYIYLRPAPIDAASRTKVAEFLPESYRLSP